MKAITWFEPSLDHDDAEAVAFQVEQGRVNQGPVTRQFEETVAEWFNSRFDDSVNGHPICCVATPSGTTAIALALMALGIGPGDGVLIPDLTFVGTASAVKLCGAEPVLCDVDPVTLTLDVSRVTARGLSAIVPVYLNGRTPDMSRIRRYAEKNDLVIVEDCAEALSNEIGHGYDIVEGQAACFSLAPTKTITSGQGGFVLTADKDVRDRIIRLKDHGRLDRSSDRHEMVGYNFKWTDIQAALALSQWEKLDRRIARAKEIDRKYRDGLRNVTDVSFLPRPYYGHLMWPDLMTPKRDELVAAMREKGIQLRPFWPPLPSQPAYQSDPKLFPAATWASRCGTWLPCGPDIANDEIDLVIDEIREFFDSNARHEPRAERE